MEACLKKLGQLIDEYQPDVVVVENCTAKRSRRCERVRQLIDSLAAFATERKIRVRRFSWQQVQSACGKTSKHGVATAVAERFPELVPILPPPRRPWESEAHSMAVFDAVALGLVLFKCIADNARCGNQSELVAPR
jgi:Holliday junction resolvasome RuvABC endonuclease subunit